VEYLTLAEFGQGIFATTSIPSSVVIRRALLKPPSILSTLHTEVPFFVKHATTSHNFRTSNLTCRFKNSCFSSNKNRPLEYWKSASSLIDSPFPQGQSVYARTQGCSPRHENESSLADDDGILRFLRRARAVALKTARIAYSIAWISPTRNNNFTYYVSDLTCAKPGRLAANLFQINCTD